MSKVNKGLSMKIYFLKQGLFYSLWGKGVCFCPGFGQDRVNFHRNPGRGTAGAAGPTPTWPNRARYSVPCAVTLGSGGGGGGAARTHSRLGSARRRSCSGEQVCDLCSSCHVFSFSVLFLLLFPLFAVLLNCPYPAHQFLPLSFQSPLHPGRGRGGHVALLLPAVAETKTLNWRPGVRRG